MQYPLYKPFLFLLTLTIPVGASQQATPKGKKELSANKNPSVQKETSAHLNLQDSYGRTELMYASSEGDTVTVQELLALENIKVNLQDKLCGRTALMLASLRGYIKIVEKLLKRKDIDINQQDKYGRTALMYAVRSEKLEVVQALLAQKDIDVNLQDQLGKTALMRASLRGHIKIVEKLLQKKANPNQPDKYGNTMLYHCIEETFTIPKNNHQTLLAWLLDTGVKQYGLCPFILNNKNELPQDLYKEKENKADINEHFKKASQYLHKERGCLDFHQQKKNLMIVGRHLARKSKCKKTIPSEIDQLIAFYASGHACFPNATLKERQPTKTSTIHT